MRGRAGDDIMSDGIDDQIRRKMESRGIGTPHIERFLQMVRRVRADDAAHVPLSGVSAPDADLLLSPPSNAEDLRALHDRGVSLLSQAVVIKLNGGRSTTMGGEVPKGALTAKDGLSYLEIIIHQMRCFERQWQVHVPLVLMNSFFTHAATMEIVNRADFPVLTFLQNPVPRLVEDTLAPLSTGTDEDWAPAGHGDVYTGLLLSGLLEKLRSEGRRWAFISNLDNLAAHLDPFIPGLMERDDIEFLLEVTDRTAHDRKGGTLVVRNGGLYLLEIAQVSDADRDLFMDVNLFRVFNTNNVWVDLDALDPVVRGNSLDLPIIRNRKTVAGTRVIQLETAMGAAIGSFDRSRGLRVGRDRFFPTKKVEDLFVLQSDACVLDSLFRLRKNPERSESLSHRPAVSFSPEFLDSPLRMTDRFADPSSVSLVDAESLWVSGDVFFERDVKIEGNVKIVPPPATRLTIPSGTVLVDGEYP
ncbi:MAG: UTP--glucose-1-phosphate uridylyltransferase [Desulfomonilaceae bacterium]|nr:UTP--glucose-1-phosphate uridylyltransferase [Desulfomonilaceae bacterium]